MKNIPNDFNFHAASIEEAVSLLESDKDQGLSDEKAKERLERFGLNSIAEAESITLFEILVNQFKSPIVFLLLFEMGLSEKSRFCFITLSSTLLRLLFDSASAAVRDRFETDSGRLRVFFDC